MILRSLPIQTILWFYSYVTWSICRKEMGRCSKAKICAGILKIQTTTNTTHSKSSMSWLKQEFNSLAPPLQTWGIATAHHLTFQNQSSTSIKTLWCSLKLRMISLLEVSKSAASQNSIQTLKQCNFWPPLTVDTSKVTKKKKPTTMHLLLFSGEEKVSRSIKTAFWIVPTFYPRKYSSGCCSIHRKCTSPSLHASNAIWSSLLGQRKSLCL